jgi:hypothetical protein
MRSLFRRLVEHAKDQEWEAREFETSDSHRRWAKATGEHLPERADKKRWAAIGAKAHAQVAAFDKAAIEFARARRQVMIVEDAPVPRAAPEERARRTKRVRPRAAA